MAKDEKRPILPRPLYGAVGPSEFSRTEANTGLWYDKFVNQWGVEKWPDRNAEQVSWSEFVDESERRNSNAKLHIGKLKWIQAVTGFVGSKPLIEEFAHRQKRLAEQSGGRAFVLTTESRFVTGLGREHPIENGFAWHHTLGTPYLTGSSIKGLIRNWAEQWEDKRSEAKVILGGTGSVGKVLVLDALPTQQPSLEADVMTPHYSAYYQNGDAPGDWLSPTPIPFLVVAAGTPFQFALVPNTPADAPHLKTVEQWLRDALSWLGAGAKTAVGYGRFAENVQKAAIPIVPRAPSKIQDITTDQLKQRLTELSSSQVLLKVERATSSGAFQCQMLRLAPNTSNGYQPDGGWTLDEAPTLAADVIVVAERLASAAKHGKFIEVFGRLPQKPPSKLPPRRK